MNWQALISLQKALDDRIVAEHGLAQLDLVPKKVLALQVELCELANETRCFKYWSNKSAAGRGVILDEYVDVVHFVLSLCIELDMTALGNGHRLQQPDLTTQFSQMLGVAYRISVTREDADVRELFALLLGLGDLLGFSETEIEQAYLHKNTVNHQRQEQGY